VEGKGWLVELEDFNYVWTDSPGSRRSDASKKRVFETVEACRIELICGGVCGGIVNGIMCNKIRWKVCLCIDALPPYRLDRQVLLHPLC